MDRVRAWLATAPLLAAGVLVAHAGAYELTATPAGPRHAYLAHAPQVLVVLALLGVGVIPLTRAIRGPGAWAFPVAGMGAFALQEHLEAFLHSGQPALQAGSPTFLVGLLLQVPFALGAWLVARLLLRSLHPERARRPQLPRALGVVPLPRQAAVRPALVPARSGRGPPRLLRR